MSETTKHPEGPVLEDARRRLQAIIDSSSTGDSGLYLQQIAEAGLLALDTLPSHPEAQQLAEIIAQQIDDVSGPLQNIARVDEDLENSLLEFLGVITEIQEIPNISDETATEQLAAYGENLQDLSARIVWHIVVNDDSALTITEEEEAGGPSGSSPSNLTTDGNNPSTSNSLDSTKSLLSANAPSRNTGDSSSQSVAADAFMALLLQFGELSATTTSDTIPTDQLPNPSAIPSDTTSTTFHRSQTLDAEESLQLGLDLLKVSMQKGDARNLSNSISLFRKCLLLCSSDSGLRLVATGNLATALLIRYQQAGDYSGLMEAITLFYGLLKLCPPGRPDRTTTLSNLSNALMARYNREGSLLDLSEATEYRREALELCPPGHPHRASTLGNFSNALLTRYNREGSLVDLSEATERYREALELCPPGHPNRASSLNNLSSALWTRYNREGSLVDLSEAIEHHREALELRPPGHPERASSLNSVSNALLTRYQREGSLLDLSEATERYREALELCPPGHPSRALSLGNLSTALMARYNREGGLLDLSEATEHRREALELRPPGHPDRNSSLVNLSNALLTRYEREGSLLDLSEATERFREALGLCPPGHPDRAKSLGNLSNALMAQYKREGSLSDLSEATEHRREALELCPPGHPYRTSCLSNLSNALLTGYEREGSLLDLSEATERYREALVLCPPGHPDRAKSLGSLSNALMARYKREGSLLDLSEATEHRREALELCPPGHSDRAPSLSNLASALLTRYQREGSLSDLSEATEWYREALELSPLGHPHRASNLGNLSNALLTRYKREGSLSDLSEATERYREALELHPPGHPYRASTLGNLSSALLTRYNRGGNLEDLSEATERYREALELHAPGYPDRASSLANLSNAVLTRYEREGSILDLSEAMERRREVLELRPYGHPERTQSLSSLSHVLLHIIDRTDDTSDVHSHTALVQEVFEGLREAVNLPGCPPLHRLRAALLWIDTARHLTSDSMLDAYTAALDQLDIVLATRDTLENKHDQLISSEELSRCRRLGVEAASYAVHRGHMTLAVELLERGRNLLFAQIGRYRVDLEELRRVDAELADRFSRLSSLLDASVVSIQPTLEGQTAFEDPIERYRRVSSDWGRAVDDIRALKGFEDFLRSPNYDALRSAATKGPVIVVIPVTQDDVNTDDGNTDDGNSFALIISHECATPHHIHLPGAGVGKLVKLCNALEKAVHSNIQLVAERSVKKVLRSLWDLVVCPIADALENDLQIPPHSRIWWCPTSLFSLLPLHAAGHYASKDITQNFPERYVPSYTPTLQALPRARSNLNYRIRKEEKMLVVAQPDTPGQARLPDVQREADLVKKLVGAKMPCTLYSSKEGTRATVLDAMDHHSWLHLTCHGSQNFANPFQSSFHLWDGNLTLHDIMRRGLPDAEFAFLSACHTATGDRELMDEGLHLASGLQFAGFKSVVGTIWEVADIDGPVIAEAFYEALQLEQPGEEGMDCSRAAHALRKAVRKLRDNDVPISRWMRFIHIGI